jgi:hypothetical protein
LVELTETPFLAFLDPDDEFEGRGVAVALHAIQEMNADIVEFRCRMIVPELNWSSIRCWRSPRFRRANATQFADVFYAGLVNCHLHRKIIRTEVYKDAITAMPREVRERRLIRYEDRLHFAFLISKMKREYFYVHVMGEVRYYGLEDNSMSETYQSQADHVENDAYVKRIINETFHRAVAQGSSS